MALLDGLVRGFARGKFSRSQNLRPLTSKRANRRFYKGKGARTEGRHTRKGGYVMDVDKMLNLEVPDLAGFKLKPYVSPLAPRKKGYVPPS